MAKHEAILEGSDRNFTINFGPQHPAAHGVFRLVTLVLTGALVFSSSATAQVKNDDGTISFKAPDGTDVTLPPQPQYIRDLQTVASYVPKDDYLFDMNCRDLYTVMKTQLTGLSEEEMAVYDMGAFVFNSALNQYDSAPGFVMPEFNDKTLGAITLWDGKSPEDDAVFFETIQAENLKCHPRMQTAFEKASAAKAGVINKAVSSSSKGNQ